MGIGLMLALSGCQPGEQGQTGLMIDADGVVYGVVHMCHGTVTGFSMWDEDKTGKFGSWSFDEPVSDTGMVELTDLADFRRLIGDTKAVYFTAGTVGVAGSTSPLRREDINLDKMKPGEVLYVTWDDKDDYRTTTADDYEAFTAISCEGY